jgi:hypothetical protein
MHNARRSGAFLALTVITLGSMGGCDGHAGKRVDGGRPATDAFAVGDAAALAACERACQHYTAACGADDCAIDCDVYYRSTYPDGCATEMKNYFDCMASETTVTCDSDFFHAISRLNCPEQYDPLAQCDFTQGMDCRAEPGIDASCSATAKPPHFYFCKLGVEPPGACASYGLDGWYCCP